MFLTLLFIHVVASSVIGWPPALVSLAVSYAGWKLFEYERILKAEIELLEKSIREETI